MKRIIPFLVLVLLLTLAVPVLALPDRNDYEPTISDEDIPLLDELMGTTWLFNDGMDSNYISYVYSAEHADYIVCIDSGGIEFAGISLGFTKENDGEIVYDHGVWNVDYKTILIQDPTTLSNRDEFENWLLANATKQADDAPIVDPCENGHTWDGGVITQRPTYNMPGVKTFTCTVCGATKTESIAQLEKPTKPTTITLTGKFYGLDSPNYQSNYISQDTPFTAAGTAYDGFTVTDDGLTLTYTQSSGGSVVAWAFPEGWKSDALRRVTVDNQIWSQQSYDVFMEFFTLAPADPDPTDPTTPVTPDPTTPVKPDPTTPVTPDPTDPVKPDPTDPVKPDPTDPVKPDPTDPVTPDPTDPVKPDPTDPVKPDPTDPVKPDPTDPVTPDPTDPVKPDTTDPVKPDPSDPSAPSGSDPTEPTETNPIDPLEHEKNESNQTGNDSVSGVISGIPDYSADFQVAIQKFAEAASYNGTEAKLPIPAIKMPAIPGLIPSVTILGAQSLDFGEYVKLIPENIMTLVQSLLTAALIIYCFKELYDTVQYVLTLKGGKNE